MLRARHAVWLLALAFGAHAEGPVLTRAPALKRDVQPVYPPGAQEEGRTATVILSLELDAEGHVVSATPTPPGDADFDAAAVAAGLQLEFSPAEVDGVPSAVRLSFRYRFSLAPPPPPEKRIVELRGVVLDATTSTPLADVTVELGVTARTTTDAAGAFRFADLEPGRFVVRSSAAGYLTASEEVTAPQTGEWLIRLEPAKAQAGIDEEVVVRVSRHRASASQVTLSAAAARAVPAVLGDAVAVVQSLPGVARPAAGSGALVVWGAAPDETRTLIDDVPVPFLYHRGGLRSVLGDSFVSSVELVPAAYGAAWGRATGGLVRVTTSTFPREGLTGVLAADLIDGSAGVAWRERGHEGPHTVAAAARVGWLSRLLPVIAPGLERTVPLADFGDYQAKYLHRGKRARTEVLLFGASDAVTRRFTGGAEQERAAFHRLSFRHEATLADGAEVLAAAWVGVDDSALSTDTVGGDTAASATAFRAGARATLFTPLSDWAALQLGVDLELSSSTHQRLGTLGLPAREGDLVVFGQPPGSGVAFERWETQRLEVGFFAEAPLRLGSAVAITPSLRLEPAVLAGDRRLPRSGASIDVGYSRLEVLVQPRLSVEAKLHERLQLTAAGGLYAQPPAPADLSAVFGNTALPHARSLHAVAGAVIKPWGETRVEVTGYFKSTTALAARNPLAFPAVAQALVPTGEGRSFGAQVVLRPATTGKLSGWLSYALSRSERRVDGKAPWRLFDFDQTHLFSALASYELPAGFRLGTRVRWASGYPRTPVQGATYDARTDLFQPTRGAQNATRLPMFVQWDLRAEKGFRVGPLQVTVSVDLVNLTNTPNAEEAIYSFDYREQRFLTGLPFLAVAGARVEL